MHTPRLKIFLFLANNSAVNAEKENNQESNMDIKIVKSLSKSVFKMIPEKSNISDYKSLMT